MFYKVRDIEINFKENEIHFPKGYYFKQSPVHHQKVISASEINEVNLNTFPPSLVYRDNETIFLDSEHKEHLQAFAEQHKIPLVDRFDIWEHINEVFLDTEFEDYQKQNTLRLLYHNGLTFEEVKSIRKKVSKTMSLNLIIPIWEWAYLGLFDYLSWTFLTKKKYWWAMEIGMRNYKTPKP